MSDRAAPMLDVFGPGSVLGYCTNVHPGLRVADVRSQLLEHACAVKDRVSPRHALPIGLWLPHKAATQLIGDPALFESFKAFLDQQGLIPFTFNAFPWGDFHGPVVKHRVYRPDWAEYERLEYTIAIASLAADLARGTPLREVSISTLSLGWRGLSSPHQTIDQHAAAQSFRSLARHLARIEADTGCCIHIDIEPEPGCHLDTAGTVVRFFSEFLLRGARNLDMILRHIRVCHDVCHSAVMFEPQADALAAYAAAGIRVGKVQVSSAIDLTLAGTDPEHRDAALASLRTFAEDRYLHQTCLRRPDGGVSRFDDLPEALDALDRDPSAAAHVRVHFHVPVFADRLGPLGSTRREIADAIAIARSLHQTRHFEVETYAWSVLPQAHRPPRLVDAIAEELRFTASLGSSPGSAA